MGKARDAFLAVGIILLIEAAVVPVVIADLTRGARSASEPPAEHVASELARAAVAYGRAELVASTQAWTDVQLGRAPAGLSFESSYEAPEGSFSVSLASGPSPGQFVVTGVGREARTGVVRGLRLVYEIEPAWPARDVDCRWNDAPACP